MGNFKTWIEVPDTSVNGNMLSASDFADLIARENGFASGTVISSKEVNTALRQANLVAAALMETINKDSTLSVESSVSEMTNLIRGYFGPMIVSVTYDAETQMLTTRTKSGQTRSVRIGPFDSMTVEAAIKDGAGNVITETYATKTELASQESWSEEYDSGEPMFRCLLAAYWGDYSPDSEDGNENQILIDEHEVTNADNLIISIDKSATKAQCEAFYDALIVPVMVDEDIQIIVKALGDIPSVDIPVTVMRV